MPIIGFMGSHFLPSISQFQFRGCYDLTHERNRRQYYDGLQQISGEERIALDVGGDKAVKAKTSTSEVRSLHRGSSTANIARDHTNFPPPPLLLPLHHHPYSPIRLHRRSGRILSLRQAC